MKKLNRHAKVHLFLAGLWAVLVLPTLLWWHSSILWVILISIYANFVGHISAYEASVPTEDA